MLKVRYCSRFDSSAVCCRFIDFESMVRKREGMEDPLKEKEKKKKHLGTLSKVFFHTNFKDML